MLDLMEAGERRLQGYLAAASRWAERWPELGREPGELPLLEAHGRMVAAARGVLPESPEA